MIRWSASTITGSYPQVISSVSGTESVTGFHPFRLGVLFSWVAVGAVGAVEGIYGRTQYLGDWISYLNVSRAVSAHHWKAAFNPMWSPGYPALVAMMRSIFPQTAVGEWHSITLLNWTIFLFAFGCWRYLTRSSIEFCRSGPASVSNSPIVLWTSCCAFLSCMVCLDNVSSVSPDLLVTALFVLAAAQTLTLLTRPSAAGAALLGLTLGVGCWAKGAFVAFAGIFLFTILLSAYRRRISYRKVAIAFSIFLLVFLPLVAGMSWSYGQLTYGVTGPLNYAFHVNHMPHWTNWQGGPAQFGTPIHRTKQLMQGLPVFAFGAPFQATYPPYNNLAYWYRGFHHFYSFKLQAIALGRTVYFLATIIKDHPFLWALLLTLFALFLRHEWRLCAVTAAKSHWPLLLPAALGLGTYLAVHVESRYLSPFILIFSLVPLLALLDPALRRRRLLAAVLVLLYTVGAAAEMKRIDGRTFADAFHRADFQRDTQWKLAAALPAYGLHAGDAVARIGGDGRDFDRVHWAYVSHLRIIAEFGGLPWSIDPWGRTRFDSRVPEPADENYGVWFREKLTAAQRAQVIQAFRGTGAKAVVALTKPAPQPGPGWQPIRGTNAWIYRLK